MAEKRASNKNSKTPVKLNRQPDSPRVLRTPSKLDQPGIPRTVFTHGSTLQSLFKDWSRLRSRGTTICRNIVDLRLYEKEIEEYPPTLVLLIESLVEATDGLQNVVNSMAIVKKQLQAVARLQPTEEPVIGTWSASEVARRVTDIHHSYQLEIELKKYVTENIAHCRDEPMCEVLASTWELEAHVDATPELYLLTDLGVSTLSTTLT